MAQDNRSYEEKIQDYSSKVEREAEEFEKRIKNETKEFSKKMDNASDGFNKKSDDFSKNSEEKIKDKKLYRSGKDKILGGVCGGLAEYFEVDPTIVRIFWIIFIFIFFVLGIVSYFLLWLVIPKNPNYKGV